MLRALEDWRCRRPSILNAIMQQNKKADASQELSAYMAQRPSAASSDWPSKVGDYSLPQLSA
jgi:hypothetical protein